jgi:hypothetical protein
MNGSHETQKQVTVLLLSLTVSILLGFVPDWTGVPFSTPEQVLLSVGLFIAFLLLDILWLIALIVGKQAKEQTLWRLRAPGDQDLHNIRASFAQIVQRSYGEDDLFVTYFQKEFQKLDWQIRDAAEKQELRVISDYYLNAHSVFEAFLGEDNPVLRYTWPIQLNEKLFSEHAWMRFFEITVNLVEQKKIRWIRVILILEQLSIVHSSRTRKLFDFFHTNTHFDCRYILQEVFQTLCAESAIPPTYLDFGVYGTQMLFRSEQYRPEYIGVFTKDTNLIRMYTKLFDTLWESVGVARRNPSTAVQPVTLDELITFDSDEA